MDPMTLSMLIGAGSSLLSGFMQKRAQKKAERTMQGYEADQVSTEGYDRLMERISGADFDRSLYSGFQNTQRGAAAQAQRMYAQMGNPALAAQAAAADRRGAQAGLFDALSENNLKRIGMLTNVQGAKSNVEVSNMQARNQARMNLMNQRAQMAQESPWANAVGAVGSIAMSGLSQIAGQKYADKTRMQDMEFFQKMYQGANNAGPSPTQQFMQRRGMGMGMAPSVQAPTYMQQPLYMPGQINMGLLNNPGIGRMTSPGMGGKPNQFAMFAPIPNKEKSYNWGY